MAGKINLTKKNKIYIALGIVVVLMFIFFWSECKGPSPIPTDKEAFIGTWRASSGFEIEINQDGTANIYQSDADKVGEDSESLGIKVAPDEIKNAQVKFKENNILEIIKPLNYAKEYKINQAPYKDGGKYKMILNRNILVAE